MFGWASSARPIGYLFGFTTTTIRHLRLIILAALVAALAVPSAASARWSMTEAFAEHQAIQTAYTIYGERIDSDVVAWCRPQFHFAPRPGKWHAWVCAWSGVSWPVRSRTAGGELLILGTRRYHASTYRVVRGFRWDAEPESCRPEICG
jgi:hypothetical protein